MKKFIAKAHTHFYRGLYRVRAGCVAALTDDSGQLLVDHSGWAIFIILVIGVVIAYSIPAVKNDFLPTLKEKVMNMFNYSG